MFLFLHTIQDSDEEADIDAIYGILPEQQRRLKKNRSSYMEPNSQKFNIEQNCAIIILYSI